MTEEARSAYLDALDAVNKLKTCPFNTLFMMRKVKDDPSAYEYMIAMAEDIEREINKRFQELSEALSEAY